MEFRELSKLYLKSVDYEQLEPNSQKMYRSWVNRVPVNATNSPKALHDWLKALPVRAATKNQALSVIRCAYSFGLREGLVRADPTLPLKRFRATVTTRDTYYTKDEVDAVYAQAVSPREKLCVNFLKILFWTGARPMEILNLRWEDINYDTKLITIMGAKKREKGTVSRYCNLLPVIADALKEIYEAGKTHVPESYVFKIHVPGTVDGRRLEINSARTIIQRLGRKLGLKRELRHTRPGLATAMLEHGYTITDVQQTLGHKSLMTTMGYIRSSDEQKARVFTGL